jgi:hypothetical protein
MDFDEKANDLAETLEGQDVDLLQKEYGRLSFSGADPVRVVALAMVLGRDMSQYRHAVHMTSSYYSQVKHLLRKGRILDAVSCLKSARRNATNVMRIWMYAKGDRKAIDLEVAGAPDFLLAQIPLFGRWNKKKALEFLLLANEELEKILKEPGSRRPDPISAALIWSKLYALTGHEHYKEWVKSAKLTRDHNQNQMLRIARHLRFKTVDELYEFCTI